MQPRAGSQGKSKARQAGNRQSSNGQDEARQSREGQGKVRKASNSPSDRPVPTTRRPSLHSQRCLLPVLHLLGGTRLPVCLSVSLPDRCADVQLCSLARSLPPQHLGRCRPKLSFPAIRFTLLLVSISTLQSITLPPYARFCNVPLAFCSCRLCCSNHFCCCFPLPGFHCVFSLRSAIGDSFSLTPPPPRSSFPPALVHLLSPSRAAPTTCQLPSHLDSPVSLT